MITTASDHVTSHGSGLSGGGIAQRIRRFPAGTTHGVAPDATTTLCGAPLQGLHPFDSDFTTLSPYMKCPACNAAASAV